MQRRVRTTLVGAGQQSGLLAHADRSARQMLQELFSRDGYTVEVTRPVRLETPTG
jgi:hypothetical protein